MTFCIIAICLEILHWTDITLTCALVTELDLHVTTKFDPFYQINHFRDIQMGSQTTDITHVAVVFHYGAPF